MIGFVAGVILGLGAAVVAEAKARLITRLLARLS